MSAVSVSSPASTPQIWSIKHFDLDAESSSLPQRVDEMTQGVVAFSSAVAASIVSAAGTEAASAYFAQ